MTDDSFLDKSERKTARVALPEDEPDSDTEYDKIEDEDIEDGDPLADLPNDTPEIELLHSRLATLENLNLPRFAAHLKRLGLRQNFISHLDPDIFEKLLSLEELDLYDNKLKSIGDALKNLDKLTLLDLSYNLLRHVPDSLHHLKSLHTIYFVQNRITEMRGFDQLGNTLTSLELGGNKIRKIENLESLVNLTQLWIGKNKITKLEGLEKLQNLRILSAQSNRITKIEGLEGLSNLEEIYLSHNGVQVIEGLENNTKLTTLDVGNNFITVLENVNHLTQLEELWMSNNKIDTFAAFDTELKHLKGLNTLYLEGNPVQASEGAAYRRKIMLALPQLTQIDATFVRQA